MLRKHDKSLSNTDKKMSDVAYAQDLFRKAFPVKRYGKVEAALYEAYRFMKPLVETRIQREFTMRRVRTLHEGTARRVDGAELDALKRAQIEELKRERKEILGRLEHLEKALAVADPISLGQTVVPHSQAKNAMGGRNSAGIDGAFQ